MSLLYAPETVDFNSPAVSCDCFAHVYGNAADHPDRVRRYPSDMTDAEWAAVRPLLPVPAWLQGRGGRPESCCHRQLLDAIRYLVAGGISWRAMPADFPGWGRVYAFFRRWREHGLITEFHDRLRGKVREREGRETEPTAGIIDAQSVRAAATVPAASRGYDGGKKVPGRKRHIVTDTLGLLLVVAVTAANMGDRDAAAGLLRRLRRLHRDITLVWADGGYTGGLVGWCRDKIALTLEIVKRTLSGCDAFQRQGNCADFGCQARSRAIALGDRLAGGELERPDVAVVRVLRDHGGHHFLGVLGVLGGSREVLDV